MPSSFQSLSTITVFDYEYPPGDPTRTNPQALRNQRIRVQLDYSQSNTTSPQVNLQTVALETLTDQNGYWQFNLVPNAAISPANTTYLVETPSQRYTISVPNAGPVQSSTIKVGTPVTLTPVPTTVGPLTVTGAFTVNTGPVSLPAGSVGVAALAGILPIANGGTGSATQNFVDLTTNQTAAGNKTFSGATTLSGGVSVTGAATATGEVTGSDLRATGLTGAANQARIVGRNASGPPITGAFAVGDLAVDANGVLWVNTAAGSPGTWNAIGAGEVKIADIALSGGNSQSINAPNWANSLRLDITAKIAATPADLGIRFNTDTGNNYQWAETAFQGSGTNISSWNTAVSYMRITAIAGTNLPCSVVVQIPNIQSAIQKQIMSVASRTDAAVGAPGVQISVDSDGFWNNTVAISSVQVIISASTFAAGTSIRAYARV